MIHPDEIKIFLTKSKEPFVGEHWYFGHELWESANSEQICEFYKGEKAAYINASHFWFSASEKVCGSVTKDHLKYLSSMIYQRMEKDHAEKIIKKYTSSLLSPIPFEINQKAVWAIKMTSLWNDVSIAWGKSNFYFAVFWSTTA